MGLRSGVRDKHRSNCHWLIAKSTGTFVSKRPETQQDVAFARGTLLLEAHPDADPKCHPSFSHKRTNARLIIGANEVLKTGNLKYDE